MGYMHINNLYKDKTILQFNRCFALEKIHGTSAHISWTRRESPNLANGGDLHFFAGGEKHDRFVSLFDEAALRSAFAGLGHEKVVVFGEAYGGKQQAQAWRYGPDLRFVAFDVRIGDTWLAVPDAYNVTQKLGLEFVHHKLVTTDTASLDAERDAPSEQAIRNGVEGDKPREGVVLRPVFECTKSNGERVIAKHKRPEERETRTPRVVGDKLAVLQQAEAIALEWVTETRLAHVLDKLPPGIGLEGTRDVIGAMIEDVVREGAGEFEDTKDARRAIATRAARLFKVHVSNGYQNQ